VCADHRPSTIDAAPDPFVQRAEEMFRQWDGAALAEIASAAPGPEYAHLVSGMAAFLRRDLPTASRLGNAAARSGVPGLKTAGEGLADLASAWQAVFQELEQAGEVYFPSDGPQFGQGLTSEAVRIATDCSGWLYAQRPDAPPTVVFVASPDRLAAVSHVPAARLEATGTVAMALWGNVFLVSPAYYPDGYAWDRVLCHEAAHAALHRISRGKLPHLLDEGIASYLEDVGPSGAPRAMGPQDEALATLADEHDLFLGRSALEGPFYSLDTPLAARVAFLQVRWLVGQLSVKGGEEAIRKLPVLAGGGATLTISVSEAAGLSESAVGSWLKGRPRGQANRSAVEALAATIAPELLPEKLRAGQERARTDVLLADLLWGRGKREAALAVLGRIEPTLAATPDVRWRGAKLLLELGRPADALKLVQETLALFADDSRLLYCAALAHLRLKDAGQAAALARRAWLVNPFATETIDLLRRSDMAEIHDEKELLTFIHTLRDKLMEELHRRIIGQEATLDLVLVTLLTRGHSLVTGVPGLAKTLLVKTLAEVLELVFSRVQFTPDLMPSDITGTEVIQEDRKTGRREFTFVRGPVFTNLLLADEINRTPPKTQAALLQAMQEYQVTAMGKTYMLDQPFHVFATQNPIEQEGTFPLPEALLDRFMLSIHMDYPSADEEARIVRMPRLNYPPLAKMAGPSQLSEAQELLTRVPVPDHVVAYVVKLVRASRPGNEAPEFVNEFVTWGAGPRAAQFLLDAAKAWALLMGQPTPSIQDVKEMAAPVLRHRLVLNFRAETEHVHKDKLIAELVKEVG